MSAALREPRHEAPPAAKDADQARPRDLLRFITCGSVDDGKSTLIGRLLAETGSVPDDVLAALESDSARLGKADGALDHALLVDGLSAEREQGITIDVAYRYFATPRRSFIVADTPGHEQYTRNMATGASGADLAVLLVDAERGLQPQTRRHAFIVALMGVRHVVVAVNKMDRLGWDEAPFRRIEEEALATVGRLGFASVAVIPLSARDGGNLARRAAHSPWHRGPTLLEALETADAESRTSGGDAGGAVLPVQWVNRPDSNFRGFAGTMAAGVLRPGDAVVALPSGGRARVGRIVSFDGDLPEAVAGQAVTVTLDNEIDLSRGDVLASPGRQDLAVAGAFEARLLVTAARPIAPGDSFLLRLGTATAAATVEAVTERVDLSGFGPAPAASLPLNAIGTVRLSLDRPLTLAPYASLRELGSLILVDRLTNETAALGTVTGLAERPTAVRPGPAARAALRRWFGPGWHGTLWPALTWRIGSAGLLALAVFAATGQAVAAAFAGLADAVARVVLRRLHGAAWRRKGGQRDQGLLQGGGGI